MKTRANNEGRLPYIEEKIDWLQRHAETNGFSLISPYQAPYIPNIHIHALEKVHGKYANSKNIVLARYYLKANLKSEIFLFFRWLL
jgi:hypothetical protein